MKFTTRGFTLVELMIVIAIIGILAAALFPSMTGYLKRSRDAARASGMKDISTALGAYYADKEVYLSGTSLATPGCLNTGSLSIDYMPKGVPQDPTGTKSNYNCTAGRYLYASNTGNTAPAFVLAAYYENNNGGNFNGSGGVLYNPAGALSGTAQRIQNMTSKGAGSGYVMTN